MLEKYSNKKTIYSIIILITGLSALLYAGYNGFDIYLMWYNLEPLIPLIICVMVIFIFILIFNSLLLSKQFETGQNKSFFLGLLSIYYLVFITALILLPIIFLFDLTMGIANKAAHLVLNFLFIDN